MARVEIITGPERGRSWSEEQKRANVDAGFAPGAIVAGRPACGGLAVCAGQIGRSIAGGRSWASPGSGSPEWSSQRRTSAATIAPHWTTCR
jgi:hypothetical protein